MKINKPGNSKPPEAPEINRKIQLNRLQMVGMPLIMLMAILALLGAFGETVADQSAANDQVEIHVTYPARFRYKMVGEVIVSIQNVSEQPLSMVMVNFDRSYIERFVNVKFIPEAQTITEEAFIVELSNIRPQETQIIFVQLQAEDYWRHEGEITATSTAVPDAAISLNTLVFP